MHLLQLPLVPPALPAASLFQPYFWKVGLNDCALLWPPLASSHWPDQTTGPCPFPLLWLARVSINLMMLYTWGAQSGAEWRRDCQALGRATIHSEWVVFRSQTSGSQTSASSLLQLSSPALHLLSRNGWGVILFIILFSKCICRFCALYLQSIQWCNSKENTHHK